MNTNQIIELALQAGFPQWWINPPEPERQNGETMRMLEQFASLVVAAADNERIRE